MQPYIADISNNSLALSAYNIAKIFSKGFSLPFARANNSSGVTLYFAKAYASSFTLSSYPVAPSTAFQLTTFPLITTFVGVATFLTGSTEISFHTATRVISLVILVLKSNFSPSNVQYSKV